MCGFCGLVTKDIAVDEDNLRRMNRLLQHRGPDEEGYHLGPFSGLAHMRLSIIDLASGRQPIYNEQRNICIVFNGEIYNYRELRNDLIANGHNFTTNSDTEVILHLYEDKGTDCLQFIRGMFAFAIWNEETRELFLARDRVGKKPLYYTEIPNGILFASEMKSLLLYPLISRQIDYESLGDFLTYSYIPAPKTILRDISKLEAAHYLLWKNGKVIKRRYWELIYQPKLKVSEDEAIEQIRYLLDDAVKVRLESEVPLGCLLSGGIDSAAVVAFMRRHIPGNLHTFTIGFEEEDYSEIPKARLVAKEFGTKHEEFIVEPSAIEVLPKLVWHFDEPFGDSSAVATYYVAKMARKKVTVVLNGDGGDESFFGYTRYLPPSEYDLMRKWRKIPRSLREFLIQPISSALFHAFPRSPIFQRFYHGNFFSLLGDHEAYVHNMTLFQSEILNLLAGQAIPKSLWLNYSSSSFLKILKEDATLTYEDQMIRADNLTYLPGDLLVKMDRMTMANSLEARSPFLDHHLMEYVARLPVEMKFKDSKLKYLLKRALERTVPDEILDGRKRGFTVPIERWFRGDLRGYSRDILLSKKATDRGLFNSYFVEQLLEEHESEKRNRHSAIWALLNVEMWCRTFLDRTDISSGPIS